MNTYLLFKSIHLIAVISWMAGLLYLPRIFVYHSEAIKNKTDDSVLIKVRAASQELTIEEAMKKCTEKHEEGCYVHYSNQVGFGQ